MPANGQRKWNPMFTLEVDLATSNLIITGADPEGERVGFVIAEAAIPQAMKGNLEAIMGEKVWNSAS